MVFYIISKPPDKFNKVKIIVDSIIYFLKFFFCYLEIGI